MATVTVENLRKVFAGHDRDVVALENVSFGAEGHTFVSIVGPSGCGKSTLLNILSGIETPTAGRVEEQRMGVGDGRRRLRHRASVCERGVGASLTCARCRTRNAARARSGHAPVRPRVLS